MGKVSVFLLIENPARDNPMKQAIENLVTSHGAVMAPCLVNGENEADIAFTNSAESARKWLQDTERTSIVLGHFSVQEEKDAGVLAAGNPGRVTAVSFIDVGPCLRGLIDRKKEA